MARFTGTDIVYEVANATSGVGLFNREDLSDLITNISPTERPFVAAIGKGKAKAVLHEWLEDSLRAATTNAQIEGDEFAYTTSSTGTRKSNYTQILREQIVVSGTQDVVDKAGMSRWLQYQVAKKSKELGNDLEYACLNSTESVQGDATTAREFCGVPGFVTTNALNKSSAAITQADINLSSQACWTAGGNPSMILCGGFNKRQISAFTTGVVKNLDAKDKKLVTHVDVYETDFGVMKVIPDHFMPAAQVYMIDPSYFELAYLRPLQVKEPSITGDATKRAMLMEVTLVCRAENGQARIYGTTTS
jgi:hypothetical protein